MITKMILKYLDESFFFIFVSLDRDGYYELVKINIVEGMIVN